MKRIIVYHNLNNDDYYYKLVNHRQYYHIVNHVNQYNHKIVLIIDNILENYHIYRPPLKKRVIQKMIDFLEKKL